MTQCVVDVTQKTMTRFSIILAAIVCIITHGESDGEASFFRDGPQDTYAVEGMAASFGCAVRTDSSNLYSIAWRYSQSMQEAGSHIYSSKDKNITDDGWLVYNITGSYGGQTLVSNLLINSASKSDEGYYSCEVFKKGEGHDKMPVLSSRKASLKVIEPPTFVEQPRNTTAIKGETVTLSCRFANFTLETHSVRWLRARMNKKAITNNYKVVKGSPAVANRYYIEGNSNGSFTLKIANVSRKDQYEYLCAVYNNNDGSLVQQSRRVSLRVLYPPELECWSNFPNGSLTEGEILRTECFAVRGNAPVFLSWLKDGGEVNGTKLRKYGIQGTWEVSALDNGSKIYCRAKGIAVPDNAEMCVIGPLNVRFSPIVNIFTSAIHDNGSVSFSCSATSNPEIIYFRWQMEGSHWDDMNPPKLGNNSYLSSFTLHEQHGREEITCLASNAMQQVGSARTIIQAVKYVSSVPTTTETISNELDVTTVHDQNTTETTKINRWTSISTTMPFKLSSILFSKITESSSKQSSTQTILEISATVQPTSECPAKGYISTDSKTAPIDDNANYITAPTSTYGVPTRRGLQVSLVLLISLLTILGIIMIIINIIIGLAIWRLNNNKNVKKDRIDRDKDNSIPLDTLQSAPSVLCSRETDRESRGIGDRNDDVAGGTKRVTAEQVENESNESSDTADGVVYAKVNKAKRNDGVAQSADDESLRSKKERLLIRQPIENDREGPLDVPPDVFRANLNKKEDHVRQISETNNTSTRGQKECCSPEEMKNDKERAADVKRDVIYAKVNKTKRKNRVHPPAEIIEMGETNDECTCAQKEGCIPQAMENDRNQLSDVQHDDVYAKVKKPKRKGRANQPADEVTTISETKDVSTRGHTERFTPKAIHNDSGGPSDGHHDVVYAKVNKPKRQDLVHQQAECSVASPAVPFNSQESGTSVHMAGDDQGEENKKLRNVEGLVYADLDFGEKSVRREQDCPLPSTLRR